MRLDRRGAIRLTTGMYMYSGIGGNGGPPKITKGMQKCPACDGAGWLDYERVALVPATQGFSRVPFAFTVPDSCLLCQGDRIVADGLAEDFQRERVENLSK